jgi:hypothetical protein
MLHDFFFLSPWIQIQNLYFSGSCISINPKLSRKEYSCSIFTVVSSQVFKYYELLLHSVILLSFPLLLYYFITIYVSIFINDTFLNSLCSLCHHCRVIHPLFDSRFFPFQGFCGKM